MEMVFSAIFLDALKIILKKGLKQSLLFHCLYSRELLWSWMKNSHVLWPEFSMVAWFIDKVLWQGGGDPKSSFILGLIIYSLFSGVGHEVYSPQNW